MSNQKMNCICSGKDAAMGSRTYFLNDTKFNSVFLFLLLGVFVISVILVGSECSNKSSYRSTTMTIGETSTVVSTTKNLDYIEVGRFIRSRYEYYDKKEGRYTGDKYDDVIWKEAAVRFDISTSDVDTLWFKYASYESKGGK